MKTKKLFALLLAFVLAFSLCSCWEEEESDDFWDESLVEEVEPVAQDNTVTSFTLPYLSNQTLDPITCTDGVQQTVSLLLYEGLFALDKNYTAQNVLCSHYSYDSESLTYRFSIHNNVAFSDGSFLTLDDVLATYQRAAKSERYGTRFKNVASMQLIDGELVIRLAKGSSAFPNLLDIPIVKAGSEKDDVPLGTGPYLFVTESSEACLLKNSDWWQSKALPLERIDLVGIRDNETAAYLFASRGVSMLVSDLTATDGAAFSGDSDAIDCIGPTLLYLGFNTLKAPFHEASVRAAVNACLDRDEIVSILLAGHAQAAMLPIPSSTALCPPAPQSKEISAYTDSLEQAGLTAEKVHSMTILVNEESSFKVSIAEHLCAQLSCDALQFTVKKLAWNNYVAALQSGAFDLYIGEVKLTADWDLSALIGSYGTLNYGYFSDEKTDALLSAFLADENSATANALCNQFTAMAPIAPLAFKATSVLTTGGLIEGMQPTAANPFYKFSDWQFHFD